MDYQRFRQGVDAVRRYPNQQADQQAVTAGQPYPTITQLPRSHPATTSVKVDFTLPGGGGRSVDDPPAPHRATPQPPSGRGRHRGPRKPLMRWWPWRAA